MLEAVDSFQRTRAWLSFPLSLVRKMSDDQGGNLAALVAYYGFLAMFPLLLAFASILGFVVSGDPGLRSRILHTVAESFPGLSGTIDPTISGNGVALGVGLLGALWAGLGVARAMEGAMNTIWYIPLSQRPNLWWSRLRAVAVLALLGVTFVASTALAGFQGTHLLPPAAANVLSYLGPLALNVVLYLLAFQVLTNRRLAWRAVLPGAMVGAAGWTALQVLGAYYTRHEVAHASHFYGPLAAVIGLLAWIYLGARLTIYAAQVNVILAERLWPRSLRGLSTDADRRAIVRRMAVLVAPGDGTAAPDARAPADAREADAGAVRGDLVRVIIGLRALDDHRHRLARTADPQARSRLEAILDEDAAQAVEAWRSLAASEPRLAGALDRATG
jgi:YihY family inner membrane protein